MVEDRLMLEAVRHIIERLDLGPEIPGFDLPRFWDHCLRQGAVAGALAETGAYGEIGGVEAFVAGFLQDAGVVPLLRSSPARVPRWLAERGQASRSRAEFERRLFGSTHVDAIAPYLDSLELTPGQRATILFHHHPQTAPETEAPWVQLGVHAELVADIYTTEEPAAAWRHAASALRDIVPGAEPGLESLADGLAPRMRAAAASARLPLPVHPTLNQIRARVRRTSAYAQLDRRQLVLQLRRLEAKCERLECRLADEQAAA